MIEFFRRWYHRYLSTPQAAVLILQFITVFVLIYYFSSIIGPILAAFVLAFIFERPVAFLVRHGTSRLKASILVTLTYITFVVALLVTILPPAMDQLSNVTKTISNTLTGPAQPEVPTTSQPLKSAPNLNAEDKTPPKIEVDVVVNKDKPNLEISATSKTIPADSSNTDVLTNIDTTKQVSENDFVTKNKETPEQLTKVIDTTAIHEEAKAEQSKLTVFAQAEHWVSQKIKEYTPKLPDIYRDLITEQQIHEAFVFTQNALKNWLSPFLTNQVAPIIKDTFSMLLYMIIVPIFTFYMLKDKDKWLAFGKKYLAPYDEITRFWHTINKQIGQYLTGNIIHIIISSIVNGIAFALFGLNYALLLGIGVGLSVIIPYVGSIIITIPVLVIGVMQFGFSSDFVWLLVIYAVIQLLDAYLLTPLLFSETLNLDAFTILLAIMIFGGIWGFWGVVLAIPMATFIKTAFALWPKNQLPT